MADCLEFLKQVPDSCADLIFTDPPYGISSEVIITRGRNKMKFKGPDIVLNFGDWDKFKDLNEYLEFTYKWTDECVRVLRDGGMFCSYFDRDKINLLSHYLQTKYGFKTKGYFASLKSNPVPQARKVKWMNAWEEIGLWQKPNGKLTYNYQLGQHPDYKMVSIVSGHERLKNNKGTTAHPTQKPESVASLFIQYWSNKGDLALDPFSGTGTTCLVAKQLERQFIGIEIDPKYVKISQDRLANEQQLNFPVLSEKPQNKHFQEELLKETK